MGKTVRKGILFLVALVCVLGGMNTSNQVVYAAEPTIDNAVIFTVRGSVEKETGLVQYHIYVDGIYNQTYQSFNITYPQELKINYPSSYTNTWAISESAAKNTKTTTFIIKTGSRSAADVKSDFEKMYFTLVNPPDGFPPEGSKVAIQASSTKVTAYQDGDGYMHYYTFVPSTETNWLNAYNAAKKSYMQDPRYPEDPSKRLQGYLATITSQAEQDKVYYDIATQCGWLGGTRMLYKSNGKPICDEESVPAAANQLNNNFITSSGTGSDKTSTTYWYWADGPEAGSIFYGKACASHSGTGTPNPQTETKDNVPENFKDWIYYSFWTGGEPNNSDGTNRDGGSGGEYALQFAWRGARWNDFNHANLGGNIKGYYIEYGGYEGNPKATELGGSEVTTSSEVELVMPVLVQYRSVVTAEDKTYGSITSIGKSQDRLITYETHLPFTAVRNTSADVENILGYTSYGYKFIGTQEDEAVLTTNKVGDVSGFHSTNTQRIIFLYKPNEYQLTFDGNFEGASVANVSPGSKTIKYDSPYGSLASVTRPGYTHTGWYKSKSDAVQGENPVKESELVTALGNQTVYAGWVENSDYNIHYDLNLGTGTGNDFPDKTSVSWTQAGLLPEIDPVREGYVFTGWNVVENGTKQGVLPEDAYGELAASGTEEGITLQAQWRDVNYIWVMYHLNGADNPKSLPDEQYEIGNPVVSLPKAARAGYTFQGWLVADNGAGVSGGVYDETDSIKYEDIAAQGAKYIVVEAQWSSNTYRLSYDKNDLEESSPYGAPVEGSIWEQNGFVPPSGTTNPERTGYKFMGWNTKKDGKGQTANVGTYFSQLAGGDDTVTEITLFAQWQKEREYFVRYDTNGGMPASIQDKEEVYLDTDNLLPTKQPDAPTGFEFAGWSVIYNGTKTGVTEEDKFKALVEDTNIGYIVLQAQYAPKKNYKVIYDLNGTTQNGYPTQKPESGSAVEGEIVWTQKNLLPNADPIWKGHTFLGWNTKKNGSGIAATQADIYGVLTGGEDKDSITLYAQWSENNVYTVRYELNGGTGTIANVTLNDIDGMVPADERPTSPTGYEFDRWVVADNGYGTNTNVTVTGEETFSELVYGLGTDEVPYRNYIVLKAMYKEIKNFQLAYNWNYEDSPQIDVISNVAWTDSGFVPHIATQPGKNLLGWTTDKEGKGNYVLASSQYKTLSGNQDAERTVMLYAQWEDASFIVNYDLNGISPPADNHNYESRKVGFDDKKLIPPSIKRVGYELAGWVVSENGNQTGLVSNDDTYRVLARSGAAYITLQAQWIEKTYKVFYDVNGGEPNEISEKIVKWTESELLPDMTSGELQKPGYTFSNWKLWKIDEEIIEDGAIITADTKYSTLALYEGIDETNITLQAQYVEKENVTINYGANSVASDGTTKQSPGDRGGTVSKTAESVGPASGEPSVVAQKNPGYEFVGWYSADDTAFEDLLSEERTFSPGKDSDGLNVGGSYVALFKESSNIEISYTTHNLNSKDENPGGVVSETGQSLAPASGEASGSIATANPGYHLVGWFKIDADYGKETPISTECGFTPTKEEGVYQTQTYVAVFAENEKVVATYQATSGGKVSRKTESVYPNTGSWKGSIATVEAGYQFAGWYLEGDKEFATALSMEAHFIPERNEHGLNASGNYVARFVENSHVMIHYIAAPGGTISRSLDEVAPATGKPLGSKAKASNGYHFIGWYESNSAISKEESFVPQKEAGVYVSKTYVAMFAEDVAVESGYKVEHYLEGQEKPYETEILKGVIGETVTALPKTCYQGYHYQEGAQGEKKTGIVSPSEPLTLKLYYGVDKYRIHYIVEGTIPNGAIGSLPEKTNIPYGTMEGMAEEPTFPGYTFSGWHTTDCKVNADGTFAMPNKDVTFTGSWMPDSHSSVVDYKVEHYLVNEGGQASLTETENLKGDFGSRVTAEPKEGYVGYTYQPEADNEVKSGTLNSGELVTLKLYYGINMHQIQYTIVGDTPAGVTELPSEKLAPYGSTQFLADGLRCQGYIFKVWRSSDCRIEGQAFEMPDTNVTFLGAWVQCNDGEADGISYTVEHYLEGSSEAYETEILNGAEGEFVEGKPKSCYKGYCYNPSDANTVESGTLSSGENLVLKLFYTEEKHKIQYEFTSLVPGAILPGEKNGISIGSLEQVEDVPSVAGFIFSGWHTTDCKINEDGSFAMPNRDVTFTGSWILEQQMGVNHYSIEHYLGDSKEPYEIEKLKGLSGTVATAVPKTGYVGYTYDETAADNKVSGRIEANDGLILKLYYAGNQHEVRYEIIGDSPNGAPQVPSTVKISFGESVPVEKDLLYSGYTFSGWRTTNVKVEDGAFVMGDGDVVFTGMWTKNPEILTVQFVNWNGDILKTEYVPKGWNATAPEDPTRSGYIFSGWDREYRNITESITVTAQYEKVKNDEPDPAPKPDPKPEPEPELGDLESPTEPTEEAIDEPDKVVNSTGNSAENKEASTQSTAPTGDGNHTWLWTLIFFLSFLTILRVRKKRQ